MRRDNEFLTDLETHIRELRLRINEFATLSANMSGAKEVEHGRWCRELRLKLEAVEDKATRLKAVVDDALREEIKLGARVAWNDLNETFMVALSVLK